MAGDLRIAAAVMAAPLGRMATNFERTAELARQARDAGAHLVCFPEMNLTGYSTRQTVRAQAQSLGAPLVRQLEELAAEIRLVILAGLAEVDAHGRIFATQLVAAPGQAAAVYRKTHVAPTEREALSAGDDLPLFTVNGWRFGIQLCYDAHFPELSTRMALEGAEVIFFPHASPRGTPQTKLASWCRHLTARAFDNGVFAVACNQSGRNGEGLEFPGVAVAIGPGGQILAQDVSGQEGLLCVDLERAELEAVRGHRMRYFLPNRRPDLYFPPADKD